MNQAGHNLSTLAEEASVDGTETNDDMTATQSQASWTVHDDDDDDDDDDDGTINTEATPEPFYQEGHQPDFAWYKRDGDEAIVGCQHSDKSWHLKCHNNHWLGVLGNCTGKSEYSYIYNNAHVTNRISFDN